MDVGRQQSSTCGFSSDSCVSSVCLVPQKRQALPLLRRQRKRGKPVIVGDGQLTIGDIEKIKIAELDLEESLQDPCGLLEFFGASISKHLVQLRQQDVGINLFGFELEKGRR